MPFDKLMKASGMCSNYTVINSTTDYVDKLYLHLTLINIGISWKYTTITSNSLMPQMSEIIVRWEPEGHSCYLTLFQLRTKRVSSLYKLYEEKRSSGP